MKTHILHLHSQPFSLIKDKKKTIEMRLYDTKRRQINKGDYIKFINRENEDFLYALVEDLYVFDSFETLFKNFPLDALGAFHYLEMEKYYSKEIQQQYGVVGIKIKVLEESI